MNPAPESSCLSFDSAFQQPGFGIQAAFSASVSPAQNPVNGSGSGCRCEFRLLRVFLLKRVIGIDCPVEAGQQISLRNHSI